MPIRCESLFEEKKQRYKRVSIFKKKKKYTESREETNLPGFFYENDEMPQNTKRNQSVNDLNTNKCDSNIVAHNCVYANGHEGIVVVVVIVERSTIKTMQLFHTYTQRHINTRNPSHLVRFVFVFVFVFVSFLLFFCVKYTDESI